MAAEEFRDQLGTTRLPEGRQVVPLSESEICPRCGQADLEPFANGSKWRCPACYHMAPCCSGE